MATIVHRKKDGKSNGFDSKGGGFIAGYSYERDKQFGVGVFGGYSGSKVSYKDNVGNTHTKSPFIGANTTFGCDHTFLTAVFMYTRPHHHHHRVLTGSGKGHGKQYQNHYSLDFNLSHLKITKNDWVLLPYLEAGYNIAHDQKYRERSPSGVTFTHKKGHSTSIKGGFGLLFSKVFSLSAGLASPQFTVGYRGRKQTSGKDMRYTMSTTSTTQTATIQDTKHNEVLLGVAVGGFISNTWQLSAGYQASVWKKYQAHDFMVSVKRKI